MTTLSKLYLVTRSDLSLGQQAVQAAHAFREFVEHHPKDEQDWYEKSNTIAMLATKDERSLRRLLSRAEDCGIRCAGFYEPDRNNELTAIAIGPAGKRLCRGLPLALSEGGSYAVNTHAYEPSKNQQTSSEAP